MNYPAASCGYHKNATENILGVTPECFYRGVQFRIRLDSRLKHAGMTVFGKKINLTQQAAGNMTRGDLNRSKFCLTGTRFKRRENSYEI